MLLDDPVCCGDVTFYVPDLTGWLYVDVVGASPHISCCLMKYEKEYSEQVAEMREKV